MVYYYSNQDGTRPCLSPKGYEQMRTTWITVKTDARTAKRLGLWGVPRSKGIYTIFTAASGAPLMADLKAAGCEVVTVELR